MKKENESNFDEPFSTEPSTFVPYDYSPYDFSNKVKKQVGKKKQLNLNDIHLGLMIESFQHRCDEIDNELTYRVNSHDKISKQGEEYNNYDKNNQSLTFPKCF